METPGLFYRMHPAISPQSTAVIADKMPHDGVFPALVSKSPRKPHTFVLVLASDGESPLD